MINTFESHYNDLIFRINEIRDFYNFVEKSRELKFIYKNYVPTTEKEENFQEYLTFLNEKKLDNVNYNAIIITLYGCYEEFVREISKEYINYIVLKERTSENFKTLYSNYQANIVKQINSNNIDYDMTKNQAIEEIYETHIKQNYDKISINLIAVHGGNLKYESLNKYFSEVLGLKLEQFKYYDEYMAFYNNYNGHDSYMEIRGDNKHTFSLLDDLVGERNSVAHTGRSGGTMININETINYLKVLCKSILLLIETEISKFFIGEIKLIPIEVYNHKILGFKNTDLINLNIDDYIYIKTNKISFINKINSIQQNSIAVINTENREEYGIKFEYRIKDDYEFLVINKNKL